MHISVMSQVKIGDNATTINSASLLELETTNKGFVLPRVSITDVSSSSPLNAGLLTGTVVYNTNSSTTGGSGTGIYYWNGSTWNFLANTTITGNYWSLLGNSGTSASSNFIGTTDAIDFVARTNNVERMRILGAANGSSKAGWIGMGIAIPRSALDVAGNYSGKNVITIQNTSTTGYSSVDMLDNAGNLAATFGFANSGTGTSFSGKAYLNGYGNDFLFTRGSSYDLIMKGGNGYVGLNTSTPSERLHVVGNFYLTGAFMPGGLAGTSGYVLTSAGANTAPTWNNLNGLSWNLLGNSGTNASTNFIGTTDAIDFVARTSNTERLRITSVGNVGIGLTNPSYKLAVLAASNPLYLSGVQATSTFSTDSILSINGGVVKKSPYSSLLNLGWSLTGNSGTNYATNFLGTIDNVSTRFRTNNVQRMIIDSLGRIGIGLSNPSNALSVLSASDPLYLSGVQATSTFTSDSVLTINAGVVKKTPYSSLTGNFWSITGNSGTNYATNFLGTLDNVSLRFKTNNTERMIIDSLGRVGIGASTFNTLNPAKLLVDYGTTTSNTLANLKGTVDDYFQVNLQNRSSSIYASTDYVATADDGTDSTNYVDLGINSSTYAPSVDNWGGPHDAYLYSNSRHLLIGTQATNSDIIFLVGGGRSKFNTAMRIEGSTNNIIIGTGNNQANATGNIIRGPNGGSGTNIPGGSLTLQGGSSNGNTAGGNLNLYGGGTVGGTMGVININSNDSSATNINTGTAKANVTIGSAANNIFLPKYNIVGGLYYTSKTTGQLANTGLKMTWDSVNNRLGIGTSTPAATLEIAPNGLDNPLTMHGLPAGEPSVDSILSISSEGVVGYLNPGTLLTFRYWGKTGNFVKPGQFLGSTNNQALIFKFNNLQAGSLDKDNTSFGTSSVIGTGNKNTAIGVSASAANNGTAIGASAVATGNSSAALGVSASATGDKSIAIGNSATASTNNQETAIGASALSNNQNNTAVGYNASAITNKNATAIGANSTASGTNSMALGYNTQTSQDNAVVLGDDKTDNLYVGIGTNTPSAKLDINAKGNNNPLEMHGVPTGDITSDDLLTINSAGIVGSVPQSSVSGSYWSLNGNAATASSVLGTTNAQPLQFQYNKLSAGAIDKDNTSLGTSSSIGAGSSNTAIGNSSLAASGATALGTSSVANGKDNIALGNSASAATSTQETAIGASTLANNQNNTAIGYNASAITNKNATAIGAGTSASGTNSTVIGYNAKTTQANAVILGDATTQSLYVGIGTSTPSAKLDITATGAGNNPLELHGLSAGSYPTDNILSINGSGVVGFVSASSLAGNYILNQTLQQASSNFNISGTGTIGGLLTSNGGHTNAGTFTTSGGIANINAGSNFATNINTGTSNGTVTIGGTSNNINLPKLSASSVVLTDASKNLTSTTPSANTFLYYNGSNFSWQSAATLASLSVTAPLTYNNLTGVFGITKANTTTDGYLSFTDWNTFNNKVSSITLNTPSAVFSNPINFSVAAGAATGTLSLNTQAANTIFAGPASGVAATPTFRTLVAADIPSLSGLYIQNQTTQQASSNFNISGAGTVGGLFTSNGGHTNAGAFTTSGGIVNMNASSNFATNINTGTSTGNVTIGNSSNNILLPKFNTAGGIFFTSAATGQIANTGTDMKWDDVNNRLGIGLTNPSYKLSVLAASDPLYLSGVQPTLTFNSDSILTIYNGVVKKTPYASLPGSSGWLLTGNSGTTAGTNFLGTTDAQPLVIKSLNRQLAYFDGNLYSIALGFGAVNGSSDHNVAIGYNATTNNQYTLALGYGATATGVRSVAIGNGASSTIASGAEAIAIGYNAISSNVQSTAIGYQATASGAYGVALGYGALASASQTTAIGYSSLASAQYANAIGYQAQATGLQSTAIGYKAQTAQSNTILLGDVGTTNLHVGIGTATPTAKLDIVGAAGNNPLEMQGVPAGSLNDNLLTISGAGVVGSVPAATVNGTYWNLSGNTATASSFLGTTNAFALQFKYNSILAGSIDANNTSLGTSSATTGTSNTAIGYSATASNSATAVGANAIASFASNTAIGNNATANVSSQATAIGASSQALLQNNIAVGYNAQATVSNQETVVGASAQAQGQNNIAIGYSAKANSSNQITVVGSSAQATFQNNTVVGYGAIATTNNQATAIGATSDASAQNATALGYNASASGANSTAIGYNATTSQANALVLGNNLTSVGINTSTPGSTLDVKGTLRLSGSTSGYVGFQPAAAAGSTTYTLPNADGTSGQVLSTNGSGALGWTSALTTLTGWSLTGNSGTTPGTNFIGTTDNKDIIFKTNGTEAFRATATNRLGIGTTNPGSTLDVKGAFRLSGSTSGFVGFQVPAAAGSTTYTLPSNDGTNGQSLITNGSGTLSWTSALTTTGAWTTTGNSGIGNNNFIGTKDANDFVTRTNNTERMRVTSAGDVVIGSGDNSGSPTSGILRGPSSTGGNKAGADLNIQSGNGTGSGGSGDIILSTATAGSANGGASDVVSERMRITEAGVVGIGTNAPNASTKLDVAGSVKIGTSGTAIKSIQAFATTINQSITAGGATQVYATITIPTALSSTQAVVTISPAFDLAAGIYIDDIHAISTTQIHLRLVNSTPFTVTLNGTFYVQITEF